MASEDSWSHEELKASVEAYAEMYRADQDGRRVNKAQIYRDLEARFDRNHKAFERRMQNISHIVTLLGGSYVKGLKPLSHIGSGTQPILEKLVLESGFLGEGDTSSPLTENELKLLSYLVAHFQRGNIKPDDPNTYLPYSRVLNDLQFPNDGRTPGDSLDKHAMGGLAQWLLENNLPAITGVIVNKLTNDERAGLPSKAYFEFYQKQDMDFPWQQNQIELGCNLDWNSILASKGIRLEDGFTLPDEVPPSLKEGAKKTVTVNAYERNSAARNACINEYGFICTVCDFNFETFYGSRGEGFIHVHHLIPVSDIGEEYEVDPINDLRPVCPNCHAMLHRKENISIEELKSEIAFKEALKATKR